MSKESYVEIVKAFNTATASAMLSVDKDWIEDNFDLVPDDINRFNKELRELMLKVAIDPRFTDGPEDGDIPIAVSTKMLYDLCGLSVLTLRYLDAGNMLREMLTGMKKQAEEF